MSTKSNITLMANCFSKVLFLSIIFLGFSFESISQCNANFNFTSNDFNYAHDFQNLSTGSSTKTYKWDFGDSTSSILTNPTHTFKTPNPVKVCLYLDDISNKCKDSICQTVYNCDSRFTVKTLGKMVEIIDRATVRSYKDQYVWGDGTESPEYPKVYTYYQKPGIYTICHQKYCTSTDKTETCINVNVSCEASFEYKKDPNDPFKIIFTNKSTSFNHGVEAWKWRWTFDESSKDFKTDTNPTFKYSKAGYYNVGLRFEDNANYKCADSVAQTIIIGNPPCDTTFYVYPVSNNTIEFGSKYFLQTLKFDYGDGSFNYAPINNGRFRHTYKNGGTFLVTISYVCHTKDTIKVFRRINIPPQDSCLKLSLYIRVTSINCTDTLASGWVYGEHGLAQYTYVWNTDPPINKQAAKIPKAGIYEVKVTDANKCSKSKNIIVYGNRDVTKDVRTYLHSSIIRPGVKGYFDIAAVNDGCVPANGKLYIVMDKRLIYQTATPSPDKIVGDTIFWNFKNLKTETFWPRVIFITQKTVSIKDTVNLIITATIDTLETNIENNTKKYRLNVFNSYDPNIKSVYPYGECTERYVDKNKPLTYTIQFQNTGNAAAINVAIEDGISGDLFDLSTLKVISQSHPNLLLEVFDSNKVKFRYDKINLPDSFFDEKGSHGYIMYEITPKQSLLNKTKLGGKADIYFDYNLPVSTNSIINTLIDKVPECSQNVSIGKEIKKNGLKIYPNPTHGILNLEIVNQSKERQEISIINLLGVSVFQETSNDNTLSLNIGFLPRGIYMIIVKSNGKNVSGKFFKQ
jgi:hypothetical protein